MEYTVEEPQTELEALVQKVVKQIIKDLAYPDTGPLEEMLEKVPVEILKGFLPEADGN